MTLDHLELAKGHDGFLRGKPEPVIILGIYFAESGHIRLLSREIMHFEVPGRFPATVERLPAMLPARRYAHKEGAHMMLLALAVEEDSGRDIPDLYAALERVGGLDIWRIDHALHEPLHLHELPVENLDWHRSHRVRVLLDGVDLGQACRKDDWVAAALAVVATDPSGNITRRLHFVSGDLRNDWTAQVRVVLW